MMQSLILDFKESPSFRIKINKEFDLETMEDNPYYIILVDDICDDNIQECITTDGMLKYSPNNLLVHECSLQYRQEGTNSYIELQDNTDVLEMMNDDESFNMKGVFLTTAEGYVIVYSINQYSLNVSESMTFEKGLIFLQFSEGAL